jgi:hypothetical protein
MTKKPTAEQKMRAKAAQLPDADLVAALRMAKGFAEAGLLDSYAVGVYRRVLIETIEQRFASVEERVIAWFEETPEEEFPTQEQYAEMVIRFATEEITG